MGARKPKKKKIFIRDYSAMNKMNRFKRNNRNTYKCSRDIFENNKFEKKILNQHNKYNNSRFYNDNSRLLKLQQLVQMRDHYFGCLQKVVTENCIFYQSELNEDVLEKLSLALEQKAILASLQTEIYVDVISEIINGIEKCNKQKETHEYIKKLLTKSKEDNISYLLKFKKVSLNSEIKLSSPLPPSNSNEISMSPVQINMETDTKTNFLSTLNSDVNISNENSNIEKSNNCNTNLLTKSQTPFVDNNCIDHNDNKDISESENNNESINCQYSKENSGSPNNPSLNVDDDVSHLNKVNDNDTPLENSCDKNDPVVASLNHLQNLVNHVLDNNEKVIKQKKEEKERAYIAHILEGDDSLDDDEFEIFSDIENDTKENINDNNLMNRLEKMKELFGIEENQNIKENPELPPVNNTRSKPRHRGAFVWKHEKIIQQYKYAMIASEMSYARQITNKRLFLKFFGDDSDEENEGDYMIEEKYKNSCTERISSWVVKHLMPFYKEKRIVGRNVFKTLGHHISERIVNEIQYPDEWTVKYFVLKFFPPKKKYITNNDVFS